LLIYGIKKLKLAGLRLERFDPEYSPLIPDLVCWKWRWKIQPEKFVCHKMLDLGSVTMTVSINTRTWVEVSEVISSKTSNKATLDPT